MPTNYKEMGNPRYWMKGGYFHTQTGKYHARSSKIYDRTYPRVESQPILRPNTSSKLNLLDLPSDVLVKILVELFANSGSFIFCLNSTTRTFIDDDLFWKAVCAKMRWDRKDRVSGPHSMRELARVEKGELARAEDAEYMDNTRRMFRSPYVCQPDGVWRRVTRPWFEQFCKWRKLQFTNREALRLAVLEYLNDVARDFGIDRNMSEFFDKYGKYTQPFQCSRGRWPEGGEGSDGKWFSFDLHVSDLPPAYRFGPIESWDVSRVDNFAGVFAHCFEFNADISQWDVSARSMYCMFERCYKIDVDITGWDLTKLERGETPTTLAPISRGRENGY